MLVTFLVKKKPHTPPSLHNYLPRVIMLVPGSFGGLSYKKKKRNGTLVTFLVKKKFHTSSLLRNYLPRAILLVPGSSGRLPTLQKKKRNRTLVTFLVKKKPHTPPPFVITFQGPLCWFQEVPEVYPTKKKKCER